MTTQPLQNLPRRAALTLTSLFQLTHYILQLISRWTPPHKTGLYTYTIAKTTELAFFCITGYGFVERERDFRIGGHVICGRGIDVLLWWAVAMSAAIVLGDVQGCTDGRFSVLQLLVVDGVLVGGMVSRRVSWVERGAGGGDERVEGEKKEEASWGERKGVIV